MQPLDTQSIRQSLNTQTFGSNIVILPQIDSTNEYAKRESLSHGTVVLAEEQTAGKGRMGRTWSAAPKKNILMSLVLVPEHPLYSLQIMTLGTAVAVSEAIANLFDLPVRVKWPNDVFINGKKVCGILTEGQIRGTQFLRLVVGIGCNVNQQQHEFPEKLLYPATSLREELGVQVGRNLLAAKIVTSLEHWYGKVVSGDYDELMTAWKNRCAHLHKQVSVTRDGDTLHGIFRDIDRDGSAIIALFTGEERRVSSGDLRCEKNDSSL